MTTRAENAHIGFMDRRRARIIAAWLLACCAMVFVMIVLGGITRLTHSGLSMVDWRPLMGWLPPLTEAEWQGVFERYQQYPEYQKLNTSMTLPEFKGIFWWEFSHRVLGRLIGVAFLIPLIVFWVRGWIDSWLAPRLVVAFILGGLQGVLGWYMVKSGLVDRPDVSHYRLAAHLIFAVAIYGYMFWLALDLLAPGRARTADLILSGPRRFAWVLAGFVLVTILAGAFVAGLDAGFAYNTFPLMDDRWVPEEILDLSPVYLNFLENIATVQFQHRVLAIATLVLVVLYWLHARRLAPGRRGRGALDTLLATAAIQVALGISTLVIIIPVSLAALHQAGAVLLFTAVLWAAHELRGRRD